MPRLGAETLRVDRTTAAVAILLAFGLTGWFGPLRAELPPDRQVDQKEVCLTCHELEQTLVTHAPVEAGECSSCHNPHVSRFAALLRERPATLCTSCHKDLLQSLSRDVVHAPVADGRCNDCHQPHGGDTAGLLVRSSKELCRECHAELTEWESRPVLHPPFVGGECGNCHDPHAADHPGLVAQAAGGICASCHPVTASFKANHEGYPVENAECRQCHDPHASTRSGLFRSHLHAPFAEGDCTTCHVEPDSSESFALVDDQAGLCGACHEEQVEESRTSPFPHVSAGGGRCTDCHNPHSGDGESLLSGEIRQLCLSCHDPGGSASQQDGRFATHADVDCTACHSPHGGPQPLLMPKDSSAICGDCHTHEHGVRHPLGEEIRDPRTGDPMTCLSCHGIHDAPYEMYLHRSQERDLCIGCHKDLGR